MSRAPARLAARRSRLRRGLHDARPGPDLRRAWGRAEPAKFPARPRSPGAPRWGPRRGCPMGRPARLHPSPARALLRRRAVNPEWIDPSSGNSRRARGRDKLLERCRAGLGRCHEADGENEAWRAVRSQSAILAQRKRASGAAGDAGDDGFRAVCGGAVTRGPPPVRASADRGAARLPAFHSGCGADVRQARSRRRSAVRGASRP